ncbi:MAG: nucleotidyltransferase family protein, partial [Gammaproteobacteria bacterium]|nr:nucleotidyltransferase family protein [Gammaproteobacteria bacterium]
TRATGVAPWVVLGAEADLISCRLEDLGIPCKQLVCSEWQEGLSGSLRYALRIIKESKPTPVALLVILGDQPLLSANELQRLIDLWRLDPERIVAAQYADGAGAPCILPARLFAKIDALRGDHGAKTLLQADPDRRLLPMPSAEWDIDTPHDLANAQAHLKELG